MAMSLPPCSVCGCMNVNGADAHVIVAALAADDLDRAIEAGLLQCRPCDGCSSDCTSVLIAARDSRLRALSARERYRARQVRLQRRADERAAARALSLPAAATSQPKPALPSAAAAALERAKARAAERRKQ